MRANPMTSREARARVRRFLANEDRVPDWALLDVVRTLPRTGRAGARFPVTFMGVGMTSVVYCDAAGLAFKVSRQDTESARAFLGREAEYLRVAGQVPFAREHTARLIAFRPDLGVIVRECLRGPSGHGYGRGKKGRDLWELHQAVGRIMERHGFTAPEFKEDSYVIVRGRGPVLVDAGFSHATGRRVAKAALDVAAGRVRSDELEDRPESLSYDVATEADAGALPRPVAARILRRLRDAAPEGQRGAIESRIARVEGRLENPGHLAAVTRVADEGSGSFEEHYPESARGELDLERGDPYYGRNVIWLGTEGRMVRVDPDYAQHISGNNFYPDKLAAIAEGIRAARDRVVLFAPYGTVSRIGPIDVKESILYRSDDEDEGIDRAYTTGDEELDRWLVAPEEFKRRKTEMTRRLAAAVRSGSGDLGKLAFTIRDGNHRAFGALIAGEPYVWMILEDNEWQDAREGKRPDLEGVLE